MQDLKPKAVAQVQFEFAVRLSQILMQDLKPSTDIMGLRLTLSDYHKS